MTYPFRSIWRKTLSQLIALNTDIPQADLPANVFLLPDRPALAH